MSSLQKLLVSPASSVSCKTCGKKVSIRWRHAFALLVPAALAMVIMRMLELAPLQILPIGFLLVVTAALLQLLFVPLSRARD